MTAEVHPDIRDQRTAGICTSGVEAWFTAHGLDYRTFCRGGYPLSVLRATDNALMERVCRAAETRRDRELNNG